MTKKILTTTNTYEEVIKKSLFIGVCAHVDSYEAFQSFLTEHQVINATHNCWAYRIGDIYRFNDDGEPSGTAGKPILAAIDGAGFDFTAALVIRHYGGIKLGTGGLARAYGGTIAKNLKIAEYTSFIPKNRLSIQVPFEFSQFLFQTIDKFHAVIDHQQFNELGLKVEVTIAVQANDLFKQTLVNSTKGQVTFIEA